MNRIPVWDAVFISSSTRFSIYIKPLTKVECLSISFSREWIVNNFLKRSQAFIHFEKKLTALHTEPLLASMTVEEKKGIADLVTGCLNKKFELFYIKSAVLKIISDFFKKVESQEILSLPDGGEQNLFDISKLFSGNNNDQKPDIKTLAAHFAVSESTIKRHLKKNMGRQFPPVAFVRKQDPDL